MVGIGTELVDVLVASKEAEVVEDARAGVEMDELDIINASELVKL